MLPVHIRYQESKFFVIVNLCVEELRFWKPFEKAKKGTNIVSQINFQILGQITDIYLTGIFPKGTEHCLFKSLLECFLEVFSIFQYMFM